MNDSAVSVVSMTTTPGRRLWQLVEPVSGGIYQAPEGRQAAKDLGLRGWQWYFASRTAAMGTAAPPVVTAALGSWAAGLVEPSLTDAWAVTDPAAVIARREQLAAEWLGRSLAGIDPAKVARTTELLRRATATIPGDGRAMFRAWRDRPAASDAHVALWQAADIVRERRGDDNTIAWVSEGWRAPDVIIVTELWRGGGARERAGFQGWSEEEIAEAYDRLRDAKLVADEALTDAGADVREAIEAATDRLVQPMLDAIGTDIEELFTLLAELGPAATAR